MPERSNGLASRASGSVQPFRFAKRWRKGCERPTQVQILSLALLFYLEGVVKMSGIKDLTKLLKNMKPTLSGREFVFCTVLSSKFKKLKLDPLLVFKEKEGITVIIERKTANKNKLKYSGVWALITLNVHSEISAVGFLARITKKLAENGISVNVVSAYYHDHLFVPFGKAKKAVQFLKELSRSI